MNDGAGPSKSRDGACGGKDEVDLSSLLDQGGFAVYPLTWCPHVELLPESWPETVK